MDIQFIGEALNNWKQTGSVAPSSRFLVEKMLNHASWKGVHALELGAGDGVFTHAILEKMDANSHLTSFEINENFITALQEITDERFTLCDESVELLSDYDTGSVDVIMSSLPITNFSHALRHDVLQQSHRILKRGGIFLQYQYAPWNLHSVKKYFPNTSLHHVFRNLPPAFYYVAKK